MKELERALLLAPLVLALLLKLAVPGAAKETAETISYTARKNGGGKTSALYDGSMAASLPLSPGDVLEIQADAPFSWLYLQWGQLPGVLSHPRS